MVSNVIEYKADYGQPLAFSLIKIIDEGPAVFYKLVYKIQNKLENSSRIVRKVNSLFSYKTLTDFINLTKPKVTSKKICGDVNSYELTLEFDKEFYDNNLNDFSDFETSFCLEVIDDIDTECSTYGDSSAYIEYLGREFTVGRTKPGIAIPLAFMLFLIVLVGMVIGILHLIL